VDLSVNVFPTNLFTPNGGGTWTLVAKTNSSIGIAAISAYLKNIDLAGMTFESDIGAAAALSTIVEDGAINILYGQNIFDGPIVAGVGTLSKSDGPDPLGEAAWDDATRIVSGTYSSLVPSVAVNVGPGNNNTDSNVLASVIVGTAALDADTSIVVRVAAVPEPSTIALAGAGLGCLVMLRRRLRA
jgi:hypothetical protein